MGTHIIEKTVLMFGDCPSPTMTIVGICKMAELIKEEKPRAAKTIVYNTYVDDICDSVDSVLEAKWLTSVDEVLDPGGLKVK